MPRLTDHEIGDLFRGALFVLALILGAVIIYGVFLFFEYTPQP